MTINRSIFVLYRHGNDDDDDTSATAHQIGELCVWRGERAYRPNDTNNFNEAEMEVLKELGTSRTHSAVTIYQHIPVVRKNHKNQLTQQFDIICFFFFL